MRILLNGFGAYAGGIVRVHNSVGKELSKVGNLSIACAPRDQDRNTGAKILSEQTESRLTSVVSDIAAALRFEKFDVRIDSAPAFRFFTRSGFHVVIIHDLNFLKPGVHQISRKQRAYRWILHQWTLRRVDSVVLNSQSTYNELLQFMPAVSRKSTVLPLPVDYMPASAVVSASPGQGQTRLLSFGHARNKGVDLLLSTLALRRDFLLEVIAPQEKWNEYWASMAESLGVQDRVRVLEQLSDAELADAYARADVFCMLSTYEGYGLPVAEALFSGRPTVTSALDVLRDTSRGYAISVTERTPESVVDAVERAVDMPVDHWRKASQEFSTWGWQEWVSEMLRSAS